MSELALDGVKVADFSWVGAGPRATKELADNGATVVKIESNHRLDMTRLTAPFKDGIVDVNHSAFFAHVNTSKYSATLNLQHPEGLKLAKRFVAWADVVVENYSYGFMERIGLGYEDLVKIKPDIIMASVSIIGRTGPIAAIQGYGSLASGISGHAALTGWPDKPPLIIPVWFGDVFAPLFAEVAIVAALEHRAKTGKGQYLDVSQFEAMIQCLAPEFLDYFANGNQQTRMGNRSLWAAPHGAYPCKEKDTWCAIAIFNESQWRNLCEVIGRVDLVENPKFKTLEDRKNNEDELDGLISRWTGNRTREQIVALLRKAAIPVGPVQNTKEMVEDTILAERHLYLMLEHSAMGLCSAPRPPVKLLGTPAKVRAAPCIGEHNHYVYTQLLGMSDEEFVELLNAGVID